MSEDTVIITGKRSRAPSAKAEQQRLAELGAAYEQSMQQQPGGALVPSYDEDEQTPTDRVAQLLSLAGDGGKLVVYGVANGRLEYCGDLLPEQFEAGGMQLIRDTWGAGEYELRLYGPNPNNAGRIALIKRIRETVRASKVPLAPLAAAGPDRGSSEIAELARVMQETLVAIANKPTPPPVDPMVQMTALFGLMETMRRAMGMDKPAPPPTPFSDLIAGIRVLKEVAPELTGEPKGTEENLIDLAKPVIELAREAMQRTQNPAPIAPAPFPQLAVPQSLATPAPTAQPEPQPTNGADEMGLKENAQRVIFAAYKKTMMEHAAAFAADPEGSVEKAAELTYEKMPEEALDLLTRDDWFEGLKSILPEADAHREFFDKVRMRTLEIVAEEAEPDAAANQPAAT